MLYMLILPATHSVATRGNFGVSVGIIGENQQEIDVQTITEYRRSGVFG